MTNIINIILIEGSERIAHRISSLLTRFDPKIRLVHNKRDFKNQLQRMLPDIVISDSRLSNFSAADALKISMKLASYVPFLYLLESDQEESVLGMIEAGAYYVPKDRMLLLVPTIISALSKAEILKSNDELVQKFSSDITGQHHTLNALYESEKKYRNLVESINGVVYSVDENGIINFISSAAQRITGFSPEEIIGKPFFDFIHPEDLPNVKAAFERHFSEEIIQEEFRIVTKSNEYKFVNASSRGIFKGSKFIGARGIVVDISERKKREAELKKYKSLFIETQKIAHLGSWELDLISGELFWSDEVYRIFGRTPQEFESNYENFLSYVHPEDRELVNSIYLSSVREKKDGYEIVHRIVKDSGEVLFVNEKCKHVFDSSGNIIRSTGMVQDITERIKADKHIRKLSVAVEQSPVSVIITDTHGNIEYVNKKFVEISGYDYSEVIGKNPKILNSSTQPSEFYKALWEKILSGDTWEGEILNKRKNGELFWVNAIISPLVDEKKSIVNYIAVEEDITIRKLNIELLKLNEEKFRLVFDKSSEALILSRPDGSIDAANPAACRLFQYSEQELIDLGRDVLIDPSDEGWNNFFSERKTKSRASAELYFIKKNGEKFIGEISTSLFKDNDGEIRYSTIIRNISGRKRLENELISAKEKAEESNRLKSSFLANMSHELRTPLTGILGFSELLYEEIKNQDHLEMIGNMHVSAKRLQTTLNSILDLSRIEANPNNITFAPVNLTQLVNREFKLYKSSASIKNIYFRLILPPEEIIIESDERVLQDIISNLVTNAIKFTSKGGVTLRLSLDAEKQFVSISIADTGLGISEEYHSLIFEEFRQVSEGLSRSFEGTGLGLTLVKKFAELIKAEVSLKSSAGSGSEFIVKLPYNPKHSQEILKSPVSENSNVLHQAYLNKKILIIEDDFQNSLFIKLLLRKHYSLDIAPDGLTALRMASQKNYDLFLMDINLGQGINGLEVTKMLRNIPKYFSSPIIAITALTGVGDKEKFIEAGCTDYISKPFSKAALLDKLSLYVG